MIHMTACDIFSSLVFKNNWKMLNFWVVKLSLKLLQDLQLENMMFSILYLIWQNATDKRFISTNELPIKVHHLIIMDVSWYSEYPPRTLSHLIHHNWKIIPFPHSVYVGLAPLQTGKNWMNDSYSFPPTLPLLHHTFCWMIFMALFLDGKVQPEDGLNCWKALWLRIRYDFCRLGSGISKILRIKIWGIFFKRCQILKRCQVLMSIVPLF